MKTSNYRNSLNQELKTFGLNPSDWMLVKEKCLNYRVEHKKDQQFVFHGKARKKGQKLSWEQLKLVSL